ncbi:MAG: SDR family NAD(P)-dependent oxidoreductase [Planctomycetota bacterium]
MKTEQTSKVAIVTGAASGIGLGLVESLLERDCRVVAFDRNESLLHEVHAALGKTGKNFDIEVGDVRDQDKINAIVDGAIERYGRLDYMFNNAGITIVGEAHDMKLEDYREVVDIDLYGVIHGVNACYLRMVEQGYGHIINTSSLSGLWPTPGSVPYMAAKHGVVGLSLALRFEAEQYNVGVSVVCPALVDTSISKTTRTINMDSQRVAEYLPGTPMPVSKCVKIILKGVDRNRAVIAPGLAAPVSLMRRFMPGVTNLVSRSLMKKFAGMRADFLCEQD